MSVSVTLPKMGESVVEGTIIRWLKAEGDAVAMDEPIVEISTDKIDTEIPSPAAGVLARIVAQPDETVEVGAEIAVIEEGGNGKAAAPTKTAAAPEAAPKEDREVSPAPSAAAAPAAQALAPSPPAPPKPAAAKATPSAAAPPPPPAPPGGPAPVGSPLVRKLAREQGVDLSAIAGSGPGGRITKIDVLTAANAPREGAQLTMPSGPRAPIEPSSTFEIPTEASVEVPFDRVRRVIADHMSRSRSTVADVTTVTEVDLTRVALLRAQRGEAFKAAEGFSLTYMPFIAHATVQALRAFPEFNAYVLEDGKTARLHRSVNLGIAVGRDEGLIVPVIHQAEGLNIVGLARAIRNVGERARSKGLTPDDVTGGTFTITNYGSFGGVVDTPIINVPQVAILGTGSVLKRPAVITIDGTDAIAIRYQAFFSLSYDHRWVDGHKAAQFNGHIKRLLEEADFELD